MKDPHRYDDMLYMPHHESQTHLRMSNYNRAAQFSPFAALTGYDDAISEEARYTDSKTDLDENQKVKLDRKFQQLWYHLSEKPEVSITYYVPDSLKEGGSYQNLTGIIKKINPQEETITLYDEDNIHDGICIKTDQILDIECPLFNIYDSF